MIHTADEAYLALGDYRNGAVRFRAGQFVLITEPELIPALERDGGMALLQPIRREAFLGEAAHAGTVEPVSSTEEAAAQAPSPAETAAAEPEANTTIAAGKPRGSNRMATGAHSKARGR